MFLEQIRIISGTTLTSLAFVMETIFFICGTN